MDTEKQIAPVSGSSCYVAVLRQATPVPYNAVFQASEVWDSHGGKMSTVVCGLRHSVILYVVTNISDVGSHLPEYTQSQFRRPQSTYFRQSPGKLSTYIHSGTPCYHPPPPTFFCSWAISGSISDTGQINVIRTHTTSLISSSSSLLL